MAFPLKGRVKRKAFAEALRLDRRMAGRNIPTRRGRRPELVRKALTREQAWGLWQWNRALNAGSRRADRRLTSDRV